MYVRHVFQIMCFMYLPSFFSSLRSLANITIMISNILKESEAIMVLHVSWHAAHGGYDGSFGLVYFAPGSWLLLMVCVHHIAPRSRGMTCEARGRAERPPRQ
mgnify:CR=1 FL=1